MIRYAGLGGVQSILGAFWLPKAGGAAHRGKIIHKPGTVGGAIVFQPAIQGADLLRGMLEQVEPRDERAFMRGRQKRAENDAHAIGPRDFRHRCAVRFDVLKPHGSGVAADIVDAGEDDGGAGPQADDILPEPDQHLRGGLAADAAVDAGPGGEILFEVPSFRNGIPEKDDTLFARLRRLERGVGFAVTRQFAEILHQRFRPRPAPRLKIVLEAGHVC